MVRKGDTKDSGRYPPVKNLKVIHLLRMRCEQLTADGRMIIPRASPRNLFGSFTLPLDAFGTVNIELKKKFGQHAE